LAKFLLALAPMKESGEAKILVLWVHSSFMEEKEK
jgi:hypothetical protein